MSLPPIIANLPFLKIFKSGNTANNATGTNTVGAGNSTPAKDVVEISAAAQAKLSDATSDQAQNLAVKTGELLQATDKPLGLPPDFDEAA